MKSLCISLSAVMLNKALFLSVFLLAIHLLSKPVEIQFETGSSIQLCSSLLHKDEYLCLQFGFVLFVCFNSEPLQNNTSSS